jgi:hypothetical protein
VRMNLEDPGKRNHYRGLLIAELRRNGPVKYNSLNAWSE